MTKNKAQFYVKLAQLMLEHNVWINYDYDIGWAFESDEAYDENLAQSLKVFAGVDRNDSIAVTRTKLQAFVDKGGVPHV